MNTTKCLHLHSQMHMPVALAEHLTAVGTDHLHGTAGVKGCAISVCPRNNHLRRDSWLLKLSVTASQKESAAMHMRASLSSLQGASLKPCRVSLEQGAPVSCCRGSLEPVLRPFVTTDSQNLGYFQLFDLWSNRLSHMSLLAGITNANCCEENKQIWLASRIHVLAWHTWSFMLAAQHHSAYINVKGGNVLLSCFIQTQFQFYVQRHPNVPPFMPAVPSACSFGVET